MSLWHSGEHVARGNSILCREFDADIHTFPCGSRLTRVSIQWTCKVNKCVNGGPRCEPRCENTLAPAGLAFAHISAQHFRENWHRIEQTPNAKQCQSWADASINGDDVTLAAVCLARIILLYSPIKSVNSIETMHGMHEQGRLLHLHHLFALSGNRLTAQHWEKGVGNSAKLAALVWTRAIIAGHELRISQHSNRLMEENRI